MAAPVSIVSEDGVRTAVVNSSGALSVTGAVAGGVADGAAVTGVNPVLVAGVDGSGNAQTLLTGSDGRLSASVTQWVGVTMTAPPAAGADTLSNTVTAPRVYADNYVFDGTQWVRVRGTTRGMNVVDNAGLSASATFTPAAASHTAGDINGVAAEFSFGAPSASSLLIHSASITINGGTAEATAWFLYLFSVTPPSALADGDAFTLPSGDRASFLGRISLGTALDLGDTQFLHTHSINAQFKLTGTSVFGYLVNDTTVTPANVAHIVKLDGRTV